MHLLNGAPASSIALTDRGLLYGQSVFETVCFDQGKPLLLELHLQRLFNSCQALGLPADPNAWATEITYACEEFGAEESAVMRLMQTAGSGGRGYQSPTDNQGNRVISMYPAPKFPSSYRESGITLGVAELQLSSQPLLAGHKHSNRFEQVLARDSWQSDWQEALLLDQQGLVIEATQANVFALIDGNLVTPDLSQCGVAGVMRRYIIEKAAPALNLAVQIRPLTLNELTTADEVFVSNSLIGVWPVRRLREQEFPAFSVAPKLLQFLISNEAVSSH